jgi:hypothetical protein
MSLFKGDLPQQLQFVHRTNEDGTIDSICGFCAKTVATSNDEEALAHGERDHKCRGVR